MDIYDRKPRFTPWDFLTWAFLLVLYVVIFLGTVQVARPDEPTIDPAWATVRIKSHGASGTIIFSEKGRSLILSCAHMFPDEASLHRPLQIDGPHQANAPRRQANAKLLAYDKQMDLSLIELDNGPFFATPVAPAGHKPSRQLISLGYDNMRWPITKKSATYLGSDAGNIFTLEKPWHGRSGGGLIDPRTNQLIGVVQGYEAIPGGRGLYVSHQLILRFLARHLPGPRPNPPSRYFHSPFPQACPFPGGT